MSWLEHHDDSPSAISKPCEVSDIEEHLFSFRQLSTLLDLSVGAPGPDILTQLPSLFERLTQHRMARELASNAELFQYGPEAGLRALRCRLASFLTRRYGDDTPVDPDSLVVTGGATSGLWLAGTCLMQPGAVVFVEDPTYFIVLHILAKDLGFRIEPIPMAADGMDTTALEQAILAAKKSNTSAVESDSGRYWGMIYTIPTLHNPTGITMSRPKCEQVVELAACHNLLVIADDVYNLLRYDETQSSSVGGKRRTVEAAQLPPPCRLKDIDKHGVVISNGTFSKILAPGIRLGWMELPLPLVSRLTSSGVLMSSGCLNNYMSGLVTSLLQLNLMEAHLDVLLQLYRDRMSVAQTYLSAHLPAGWKVSHPGGGYFLWVEADRAVTAVDYEALARRGVRVLAGERTCPHSYLGTHCTVKNFNRACFRISIAYYSSAQLLEACKIICEVIR